MSTSTPPPPTDIPPGEAAARERDRRARAIAVAILGGLLLLFAVLNLQTVRIHLIVTTVHWPLILVIAVCGLIGAAISWLVLRRRAGRAAGS
jgi:uncharacterized integral membrane protein